MALVAFSKGFFEENGQIQLHFLNSCVMKFIKVKSEYCSLYSELTDTCNFPVRAFCPRHVFADEPQNGQLTGHHSKNLVPCSSSVNQL